MCVVSVTSVCRNGTGRRGGTHPTDRPFRRGFGRIFGSRQDGVDLLHDGALEAHVRKHNNKEPDEPGHAVLRHERFAKDLFAAIVVHKGPCRSGLFSHLVADMSNLCCVK